MELYNYLFVGWDQFYVRVVLTHDTKYTNAKQIDLISLFILTKFPKKYIVVFTLHINYYFLPGNHCMPYAPSFMMYNVVLSFQCYNFPVVFLFFFGKIITLPSKHVMRTITGMVITTTKTTTITMLSPHSTSTCRCQ